MSALRVALRADASTCIGYGHVKRCLALAQALQEAGAEVCLVSRALGIDTCAMANAVNCGHFQLRRPLCDMSVLHAAAPPHAHWAQVDWNVDATETAQVLGTWAPHWVIVDHYSLDARWHRAVGSALSARIGVIDDLADRDLAAALVIDHNFAKDHRVKYVGRVAESTRILGGPRFALLAPSYARAGRYAFDATVRSIGIFMGGTDGGNLSSRVLQGCREFAGFTGPIEIATTSANPHNETLRALANCCPPTEVILDSPELSDFFARHDLQIGAGGGATWERCCVGAPSLAIVAAGNQREVVSDLAAIGALATPAAGHELTPEAIGNAVQALLRDPARRLSLAQSSRQLVDGLGARRVASWLASPRLAVRRAGLGDARLMFDWRNHPVTRAVSRGAAEIAWPAHLEWLTGSLADPARTLLLGSVGSIPVGVVRLDRDGNRDVAVSIYLDPAMHGLGLGSSLLCAGEAFVRADCRSFVATVLEGNTSSQRLFAGAGYRSLGDGRWCKYAEEQQRESAAPCSK